MERKVRLSNLLVNLFQFPVKENRIVVLCGWQRELQLVQYVI